MIEKTVRKIKRRNRRTERKMALLLLAAFLVILLFLLSPWLCPYDPYAQNLAIAHMAPDRVHILGTDRYGRDLFSRILTGGRTTVLAAFSLAASVTLLGTVIGLFSAWKGGKMDAALMGISDLFLAFPGLVFALAVAGVTGGGIQNAVLALAAVSWPKYGRLSRNLALQLKGSPFIDASRMAGTSTAVIIGRHMIPHMAGTLLVTAVLDLGTMMMEIAGLSFLGLGVKPPGAEWGAMISESRSFISLYPWMVFGPGAAIFITVMVFNLLGDTLRDYLDPHQL
ncbi:ABC transporter permease [Dialister sp.]|uniref:ABC transporter permease n=1 Tax=Dialister sp. TaxID=1955814 RepID=UPI003F03DE42